MQDADTATPRRTSVDTVKQAPKSIGSKRAARRKEASDIDDLVSDFGLLAVNATARDFHGFTSAMSYARLVLSASSKEPLPNDGFKPLPLRYAVTPLIQHYLTNVFILLPLFDEAALYASVDNIYHQDGNATPFDHFTVRMVLAISCLTLSERREDDHYKDAVGHVIAALEHAEEVLHPGFITGIQALVLLVEYATMDPLHFDSWTLIGAASRSMVDLGIHQDPSRSAVINRQKLEMRRRVYWCVYALDRSTSLVQTGAFSFSDDSANVSLPFKSHQPGSPSKSHNLVFLQSFDSASDLFKIRQIQSIWYTDLFQSGRDKWNDPYPYVWKTYAEMTKWFQGMPSSTLPSTKAFFELELLYSYVYILSPSPRVPHINEYAQRLIFEHCISYATNFLSLISKPSNITKPPVTYYDAMRAYMTGRQFVDVLARNQDAILDPIPPTPPAAPTPVPNSDDPLAPPNPISAPPFPAPTLSEGQTSSSDPTTRAIAAVNDYISILTRLGPRFGNLTWRDRFQRESAALLSQLYHRTSLSVSPIPSPQSHHPQPHQQQQQFQPWGQQGVLYNPTTPPSTFQTSTTPTQQQTSPFAPSTSSYMQTPFSVGSATDWTTSTSPPPPAAAPSSATGVASSGAGGVANMPQPTEGRVRSALVFGPGLSGQGQGQEGGGGGQGDGGGWS